MRVRTRKVLRFATIALPLAVVALPVAPAVAKSSRGLVFPQAALTVGWKSLEATRKIAVCNGGRTPAQLDVQLAGFKFRHTDPQSKAVWTYGPYRVLKVGAPTRIKAGRCAGLLLGLANPEVVVDPGEYSGTLVATAVGLGVIQQKLTITGPGQIGRSATVAGAVEVQQLDAENSFLTRDPRLKSSDLLLAPPENGSAPLTLGSDCKKLGSGGWSEECSFIGNLYKGDDVIHVYLAGAIGAEEGVDRLPIRIEGSNAVGSYEGVLDPAGLREKSEAVTVKMNLTDSIWSAILALVFGAALGVAIKLWSERWRLKFKLKQRAGSLTSRYEVASREARIELAVEMVSHYVVEVEDAISSYSWSTLLFDTESDGYKQIERSLTSAEDDLRLLANQLRGAISRLKDKVSAVESLLIENRLVREVPELLTRARALLEQRAYAVGDATARSNEASEITTALDLWYSLADRILADEALLVALGVDAEERNLKPTGKEQTVLEGLVVKVRALHEELFRATGIKDLERLRVSGDFESLHNQVFLLFEGKGIERPEKSPVELLKTQQTNVVSKGLMDKFKTGRADVTLHEAVGEVDSARARAVELPNRKFRFVFFDMLVLLLAASAAVVGGLAAFYFGKNWGTRDDYLVVILAGTSSQLLITAVLDHFSTFIHDLAPVASLTPAKVTVKPASASQ
jgi:hypothetical protein